jgi:hypothetical protein
MRRLGVVSWVAISLCCAAQAHAEEAAQSWTLAGAHVVVAAERAATVLLWREHYPDIPGAQGRYKGVDVSMLTAGVSESRSSMPRFAADYVFRFGLSLGGNVGVGYGKDGDPSKPKGLPHESSWVLGARAGYLLPLSPRIAVWPRLGVGCASYSVSKAREPLIVSTETAWDLTIDPQLALVIAPRIVFTTGALLDIGFAGKQSWDGDFGSHAIRYRSSAYGASAGLAVVF